MSHSTILHIWPGKRIRYGQELRNSHGSAPVIWNALAQKYCGARPFGYFEVLDRLWPLYKDPSLPIAHRAVLMMTFDTAYVLRKDYARAATDIRQFLQDFPQATGYVNHWPTIADLYESDPKIPAIGIYQTSVSENPFKDHRGRNRWSQTYSIYDELGGPIPHPEEPRG